jgi:dTMP kinase
MEWLRQKTTLQTKLVEISLIIKRGPIANLANICFIVDHERHSNDLLQLSSMLITFEGLDCSGKTTQANLLVEHLEKMKESEGDAASAYVLPGRRVLFLREPGGTELSERIRTILLDTKHSSMNYITELFLFSAARAQLVSDVVKPALERGDLVVCDRFYDSTTAYQGWGRGIDHEGVKTLNRIATSGVTPDLTFYLDIDSSEVERRKVLAGLREDRMESSGKAFYDRVREGYLEIAQTESRRFVVLNGIELIDVLEEKIRAIVLQRLRLLKEKHSGGVRW